MQLSSDAVKKKSQKNRYLGNCVGKLLKGRDAETISTSLCISHHSICGCYPTWTYVTVSHCSFPAPSTVFLRWRVLSMTLWMLNSYRKIV